MKLFLILSLIFLLVGCVSKDEKQTEKINITKETEEQKVIGVFITRILDTDEDRVNNLKICADVIDGEVIKAGETFSFNETVGRRTAEKGYKEAKIIVGDETENALGGGVCQISSTILGAATDAKMEILERHSHNKKVNYVEQGKDAAVSYGTQDFRFKNILDRDIMIKTEVVDGQVKAEIIKM